MEYNGAKTGTTCIGLKCSEGIILASDMRATTFKIESDSFIKVFDINDRIASTVAGVVSDAQLFIRLIKGELKLLELKNERKALVSEAAMILNSLQYRGLRTQGSVVSMIVGGYDEKDGYMLYDLGADGAVMNNIGYVVTGSGEIFAKPIIQSEYNEDMTKEEALKLVEKAFRTTFQNDNSSGGGFVAKIITDKGIEDAKRKVVSNELVDEGEK